MLEKGDIKRSRVFFWEEEEGAGKREEQFFVQQEDRLPDGLMPGLTRRCKVWVDGAIIL